jgi:hypothetical protein
MYALLTTLARFLYTLHTSYDGSFQLSRKNKPSDAWDCCVTDGRMYFAREAPFQTFFQDSLRSGNKASTKVGTGVNSCEEGSSLCLP